MWLQLNHVWSYTALWNVYWTSRHVVFIPGCEVWGFSMSEHVLCPGWCSWVSVGVLWEPHIAFPCTGIRLSAAPSRQIYKEIVCESHPKKINKSKQTHQSAWRAAADIASSEVLTCWAGTAYSLRKSSAKSVYSLVVLPGLPYLQTRFNIVIAVVKTCLYVASYSSREQIFTSQTAEPRCEEPTSYISTMAARAARLHLSASSPARTKDNVCTLSLWKTKHGYVNGDGT